MGDFRKKNISYSVNSREEKLASKYLGKIISCIEKKYRSWRIMPIKNLTPSLCRDKHSYPD